jgi:hypothetical protein
MRFSINLIRLKAWKRIKRKSKVVNFINIKYSNNYNWVKYHVSSIKFITIYLHWNKKKAFKKLYSLLLLEKFYNFGIKYNSFLSMLKLNQAKSYVSKICLRDWMHLISWNCRQAFEIVFRLMELLVNFLWPQYKCNFEAKSVETPRKRKKFENDEPYQVQGQ